MRRNYCAVSELILRKNNLIKTCYQLGASLEEEECKNSMQSSTALARCESVRSDSERDLTKVDEETFLEDLLLTETSFMELVTFAPSCSRNLTGDNIGSLGNLKVQVPLILFLFLNALL